MRNFLWLSTEALRYNEEKKFRKNYYGVRDFLGTNYVGASLGIYEIKYIIKECDFDFIATGVEKIPSEWWECGCDIIQFLAGNWYLAQKDSDSLPLRINKNGNTLWQGAALLNFTDERAEEFFKTFGNMGKNIFTSKTNSFTEFNKSTKKILQQFDAGIIAMGIEITESWKAFFNDPDLINMRMFYWDGKIWWEIFLGKDQKFIYVRV